MRFLTTEFPCLFLERQKGSRGPEYSGWNKILQTNLLACSKLRMRSLVMLLVSCRMHSLRLRLCSKVSSISSLSGKVVWDTTILIWFILLYLHWKHVPLNWGLFWPEISYRIEFLHAVNVIINMFVNISVSWSFHGHFRAFTVPAIQESWHWICLQQTLQGWSQVCTINWLSCFLWWLRP